jgi:hypothetical protein
MTIINWPALVCQDTSWSILKTEVQKRHDRHPLASPGLPGCELVNNIGINLSASTRSVIEGVDRIERDSTK